MEGTNPTLQLVALAGSPLISDLKLLASCKCKQLTDSIGTEVLGVFEELIPFPSREGLLCKASTDVFNALVVGPTLRPKRFCVLRDRRCWKTWKKTLKVDKRQISLMEEEVAKAVDR
ncbi:hypothetical protein YC2023_050723 [Brassica napus]|uniref:Uncharacterized protein n=1 Tax=Brassica oleracea TaxID=3712 RepID=A0A3P6BR89_BRAOL|nr:unnamed protein product [Brassica oleracea]